MESVPRSRVSNFGEKFIASLSAALLCAIETEATIKTSPKTPILKYVRILLLCFCKGV